MSELYKPWMGHMPRQNTPWNDLEEQELIRGWNDYKTIIELAEIHGRKSGGIRNRLSKLINCNEYNDDLNVKPKENKMEQHKHADVLIAIATGKPVQYATFNGNIWIDLKDGDVNNPIFQPNWTWRIKPEVKPDVVMYGSAYANMDFVVLTYERFNCDSLKLTFDGETNNLKDAEVIK